MNKTRISRKISYLLRHNPENLKIDSKGFVLIKDLLKKINISESLLNEIVEEDSKSRYLISGNKIRASQGHSINVDLDLKTKEPPQILYHGTSYKNLKYIYKSGIKKMKRQFVHLSSDEKTAINVGSRHGRPVVLKIDSLRMQQDGIEFYLSENNVWLVLFIDNKYIIRD